MAVFTFLAYAFPQTFGANAAWLFSSRIATQTFIATAQAATWSIASAALARQNVPHQKVQATINQTDAPRVRAYGRVLLGGLRAFFEADDGKLYQIIVLHHGPVDSLIAFRVDGRRVTVGVDGMVMDSPINPDMQLYFRDGTGQGGDYATVRSKFPTLWTPDHRLQAQATMLAVMTNPGPEQFAEVWPKGPQTVIQAEVRGTPVRNMAGDLVYSDNAGLGIRDYLTHPDGWRIPQASIDNASFGAFVARCGEHVPLRAGGTEARYRIGGTYSLDDAPKDVAAMMLAACDGQIYQTPEGKVGILGGAWSEPDVTITADDILELSVEDGFDPFTDFNILKGSFLSPAHDYQPTEVPELRDEAALALQGARSDQVDIHMCPSGSQMQRLLKIVWAKRRRALKGTMTTNLVGLKARFPKGDGIHTIRVRAPDFGIDGIFEVTSHAFNVPDGTCQIGIASIDNPYLWDVSEEQPVTSPTGDLPTLPRVIPPPEGASLTQVPVRISGDTYGGKLQLTVNPVDRADLRLEAQVAEGNVAADAAGTVKWTAMSGDRFVAETGILENEKTYTVRYRWRGQKAWQKAGSVTIVANPNVPASPAQFARVGATGAQFQWRNPADNFWKARLFRNTANTFAGASFVDDIAGLPGQVSAYTDDPGTGTWHYFVVALNNSTVASPPAGPITVTI